MMGDMNAKVGSILHSTILGNFGLGKKMIEEKDSYSLANKIN